MAFQAVLETAQIDHIFTLNDVTVQNTYHAKLPGGYVLTDLQDLADRIDGVFDIGMLSDMPEDVIYVRTEVRGLELENDQIAEQDAGSGPGTHAGQVLPNNVTFAIKKASGRTGRSARGRIFWIGIPETELNSANENNIKQTYATSIVADIEFIRTSIAAEGLWEPVIVSRWSDGVKRSPGTTFPWVSTSNVDLRVDTHRGRLPQP